VNEPLDPPPAPPVEAPDLTHPVFVHFYRAVVAHMDVWRQRMDATTNWAAATTAAMVTFSFGSTTSPHFVLLLALGFNGVFLLMESRRYQTFDLWRRRFRLLNRHVVVPVLTGTQSRASAEQREALARVADDLGRMVPHVSLTQAAGFRIRRNYAYLLGVGFVAWVLKLEVHPVPTDDPAELVRRAAVGAIPGTWVVAAIAVTAVAALVLAIRAPSEGMLNWADIPSPYRRWLARTPFRRRGDDARG
jgi:uncharacterized membrane protein